MSRNNTSKSFNQTYFSRFDEEERIFLSLYEEQYRTIVQIENPYFDIPLMEQLVKAEKKGVTSRELYAKLLNQILKFSFQLDPLIWIDAYEISLESNKFYLGAAISVNFGSNMYLNLQEKCTNNKLVVDGIFEKVIVNSQISNSKCSLKDFCLEHKKFTIKHDSRIIVDFPAYKLDLKISELKPFDCFSMEPINFHNLKNSLIELA